MKISTKLRYGLRAMIELGLNDNENVIMINTIAKNQKLSKKYLEILLVDLKKAGLVRSIRGNKGGYALSKQANEITVYDIFKALEGPASITDCVINPGVCANSNSCTSRGLFKDVSNAINNVLMETTLEELVRKEKNNKLSFNMYYI